MREHSHLEVHLRDIAIVWLSLLCTEGRITTEQQDEAIRRVEDLLDDGDSHWPLALKRAKDGMNAAMRQVAHDLIPGEVGE